MEVIIGNSFLKIIWSREKKSKFVFTYFQTTKSHEEKKKVKPLFNNLIKKIIKQIKQDRDGICFFVE